MAAVDANEFIREDFYAKRLKERSKRYTQAKEAAIQVKDERKRFFRRRRIQSFLDITQFKILIPLPILALFLSIILTCLYLDGLNVNIWVCAAPLLFYFVYLFLFCLITLAGWENFCNTCVFVAVVYFKFIVL
jgi:hypothetical protein